MSLLREFNFWLSGHKETLEQLFDPQQTNNFQWIKILKFFEACQIEREKSGARNGAKFKRRNTLIYEIDHEPRQDQKVPPAIIRELREALKKNGIMPGQKIFLIPKTS